MQSNHIHAKDIFLSIFFYVGAHFESTFMSKCIQYSKE